MFIQKFFDYIYVDAMTDVKERLVVDDLLPSIDELVFIYHVETEMKMLGEGLHTVDHTVFVEQRTAALAAETGGAELDAYDLTVFISYASGVHAIYRETGCSGPAKFIPYYVIVSFIITEIGELGEGEPQPYQSISGADRFAVFSEYGMTFV